MIDQSIWGKTIVIILIVAGTFLAMVLVKRLLEIVAKKITNRTQSNLDNAILGALKIPIYFGVVLLGIWLVLMQFDGDLIFSSTSVNIAFFLAYWFLGYLIVYRLIVNLSKWYQTDIALRTETTLDEQIVPFARRIVLSVVTVIAIIILLGRFNVNSSTISAFITTLGIGSLAIALAAQATLGDVFSGFMIMIDRPFRIGDRIELVDLQTWGDVKDIGLRSTRILTRDNRFVIIPNSLIAANPIVNHSLPSTMYRVQTEVGVAYGLNIDEVRKVLVDAVFAQSWVMKDKPIEALFLEFQDSGLLFRVRCWIESYEETRRTIDKLNTCIYKALNEAEMEIPFPQRVVHLEQSKGA